MNPNQKPNNLFRFRTLCFSAFLVLAILGAALPQPARAAVTCQTYYWVREGDTTPYIAHTFGFKWRDIAEANGMKTTDRLTVGQRLCIPPAEASSKKAIVPETDENANIQVTIYGDRVYLNLSKFSEEHNYRVKVREVGVGIGGWYKLGTFEIKKNKSYSFSYNLPRDLWGVSPLSVCLKDMGSDELICRYPVNP